MSGGEPALLDALLDRAVLPSYTRVGFALRRRSWEAQMPRLDGRVALVTGASSGVGAAVAEQCAQLGASVWLLVRNRERGERTRATIAERVRSADIRVAVCDLSSLESVRAFARQFASDADRLDALVNNAGVLTHRRMVSKDGIELTLATNVVGPQLLTELLMPMLDASGRGRVVNVSSGGMYTRALALDDLQSEKGEFRGSSVYARTKRIQVALTRVWADRLRGGSVTANAMHPGWVDTPGLRESLPRFHRTVRPLLRTPAEGADTIVWLVSAQDGGEVSGAFWFDRARRPINLVPWTRESEEDLDRLWSAVSVLAATDMGAAR